MGVCEVRLDGVSVGKTERKGGMECVYVGGWCGVLMIAQNCNLASTVLLLVSLLVA